jgi:deoxyhypusine synthase
MNVAELWLKDRGPRLDVCRDVNETAAIVYEAKKSGGASAVLILGGGSPKNFILQTEPQIQEVLGLDDAGHDYFVQVTDARPDTGGLSGATPGERCRGAGQSEEALVQSSSGDSTIIAPLLTAYGDPAEPRHFAALRSTRGDARPAPLGLRREIGDRRGRGHSPFSRRSRP